MAERFGVDYVSAISDPCVEAADLGAAIKFFPDQPPAIDEGNALLKNKAALAHLKIPDPHGGGRMTNRIEAVRLMKERVGAEKLVEGWVAALRGVR